MTKKEIKIPVLGEGLRQVRILGFFKQVGEFVQKDQPLYEIETDKATVEIESSESGVVQKWCGQLDDTVDIGSTIAIIEVDDTQDTKSLEKPAVQDNDDILKKKENTKIVLPPRTKRYAKQKGVTVEKLVKISPAEGKTVLPKDVDIYLKKIEQLKSAALYDSVTMSPAQRNLLHHMRRSQDIVIPSTLTFTLSVPPLLDLIPILERGKCDSNKFISEFQVLSYFIAQTINEFPKLKTTYSGGEQLKQYEKLQMGIAVTSENKELLTAKINDADHLDFSQFCDEYAKQLQKAMQGENQVDESVSVILSYLGNINVLSAVPLLVAPAVLVIFVGNTHTQRNKEKQITLSLTFNHVVINGHDIAQFANGLDEKINSFCKKPNNDTGDTTLDTKSIQQQAFSRDDIESFLVQAVARILSNAPEKSLGLGEQGMDSMQATQLIELINQKFNLKLSPTIIWHHPTIVSLSQHISLCKNKAILENSQPSLKTDLLEAIEKLTPEELLELDKRL